MRNHRLTWEVIRLGMVLTIGGGFVSHAHAQYQGPSSSQTPYTIPTAGAQFHTISLLTTGDTIPKTGGVGSYRMAGIPDGLGAYDNGNGTFTVLMNHEIPASSGVVRDHGAKGAFVSAYVIDKSTLQVLSGHDLIQDVTLTTGGSQAFNRFCSADLPATSAFYNPATGLGTQNRIFMTGEETNGGRAFAAVATGPDAGHAYELTQMGKAAWENTLANPATGNKTVVVGMIDSSSGNGIVVYSGDKTNVGTDIDKAGLTNGTLYAVKVDGVSAENRTTGIGAATTFSLVTPQLAGVDQGTRFLRTEDGAWDPQNPDHFYFVTTDQYNQVADGVGAQIGNSRLWEMVFQDPRQPELGGSIRVLLNGLQFDPNSPNMADNISVNNGHILIQEDVGNQEHNGKTFDYEIATGNVTMIAKHDPARFGDIGLAATAPFNRDEEDSGVIDISDILGYRAYLITTQSHYPNGTELFEGGQLQILAAPEPNLLLVMAGASLGMFWRRRQAAAPVAL
ncbi:MAG: hypothetical protein ACKV0T_07965 [Planctomycetales bacterium]